MPISIQCDCGKALRVKDELAGRKVRCPDCKTVIAVAAPEMEKDADDEALDVLLAAGPPAQPAKSTDYYDRKRETADDEERVSDKPMPAPKPMPTPKPQPDVRRTDTKPKRRSSRGREGGRFSGIVLSPTILSGLLMMACAVTWFGTAFAMGIIYFYPPVLLCSDWQPSSAA